MIDQHGQPITEKPRRRATPTPTPGDVIAWLLFLTTVALAWTIAEEPIGKLIPAAAEIGPLEAAAMIWIAFFCLRIARIAMR
jgi:hypothetical protein